MDITKAEEYYEKARDVSIEIDKIENYIKNIEPDIDGLVSDEAREHVEELRGILQNDSTYYDQADIDYKIEQEYDGIVESVKSHLESHKGRADELPELKEEYNKIIDEARRELKLPKDLKSEVVFEKLNDVFVNGSKSQTYKQMVENNNPSLNNVIKEVTDNNKIVVESYRTGQTWETEVSPQEADIYRRELEKVGTIETTLFKNNHEKIEQEMVTPVEKNLQPDEEIAEKLNFLTDSNGNNHYTRLKDNKFQCVSIEELNKGQTFTDYSIELEDSNKNNFQYDIRTTHDKKEIRSEWTKEKTGKQWLDEDLKKTILERNPNLTVDNPVPEKSDQAQDIQAYTQERKTPQPKM